LLAVGFLPVGEEQEHADPVHDQAVVADVQPHPVVGQQRDVGGQQRRLAGGQDPVRALLAQLAQPGLLGRLGLAAQVQPAQAQAGVRLGDLPAVGGEPGAQRAVPGRDRAQGPLQPV